MSDRSGEHGSVLALVPAGLLVLVLLAAIAVDSSVAYLGRRELAAAADAAANNAVTYGLDEARFRETGAFALDPGKDRGSRPPRVDARDTATWSTGRCSRCRPTSEAGTVTVTLRSTAALVFAPAVPGAPNEVSVVAQATADVLVGD